MIIMSSFHMSDFPLCIDDLVDDFCVSLVSLSLRIRLIAA